MGLGLELGMGMGVGWGLVVGAGGRDTLMLGDGGDDGVE